MSLIFRQGQVDQIITSIIIVFFALFLSGIFVVVSSNIAEITAHEPPEAREATVSASGSSQALLDIFLSDEIAIGTSTIQVQKSLSEFFRLSEDEKKAYARELTRIFSERYSCEGRNILIVYRVDADAERSPEGDESFDRLTIYIDYPRVSDGLVFDSRPATSINGFRSLFPLYESFAERAGFTSFPSGLEVAVVHEESC